MLSQSTQRLIHRYQAWYQFLQPKEKVTLIHVDEVAAKVAAFYEKFRGVIEWREEHLMRKTAIERILKRRLIFMEQKEEVGEAVVLELIRGGHFPNDTIPESKIPEVEKIIGKYLYILENAPPNKQKLRLQDWLFSLAACEIEETLSPALRENALIDYMTELMGKRIVIEEIPEEEKGAQIYIACQKSLFKLDTALITYNLLKKKYPDWKNPSPELITKVTEEIFLIKEQISRELSHPLTEKFYQVCEKYDTAYLILGDIISKEPNAAQQNLENPEVTESFIKEAYQKRLVKIKEKLRRAAIYVTFSIFITKILVALAIEVPFDKYVIGHFDYFVLGTNIILPPFLMFLLILTIRPPQKENLQRVIFEVIKLAKETEVKDRYLIKKGLGRKKKVFLNSAIFIFYLLSFFIVFGLIIYGLGKLNFGFLSQLIFIMFLSLILFAGVKLRQRAKELQIIEEKETIFGWLWDFLTLPIIRVGKWLSGQLSKYNLVVILFTALVDMPFQFFIEFLEHWRVFLKEKKEEIH